MPRFHFHLEASNGPKGDQDGRELPDDRTAIAEGGSAAGESLMDELTQGALNPRVVVTVMRSNGQRVAIIKAQADVELSSSS